MMWMDGYTHSQDGTQRTPQACMYSHAHRHTAQTYHVHHTAATHAAQHTTLAPNSTHLPCAMSQPAKAPTPHNAGAMCARGPCTPGGGASASAHVITDGTRAARVLLQRRARIHRSARHPTVRPIRAITCGPDSIFSAGPRWVGGGGGGRGRVCIYRHDVNGQWRRR